MGRDGSRVDGNEERADRQTTAESTGRDTGSAGEGDRRHSVESLHGTVGNQAVERLYEQGRLQATLEVGRPDDEREREAERVANEVVRSSDADEDGRQSDADGVVRSSDADEDCRQSDADGVVRSSDAETEPTVDVSRSAESGGTELTGSDEREVRSALSGGRPLSSSTREYFEPRFGRDFSDVRVHTGPQADEAARSIDAEAFTLGTDIAFAKGRYRPSTDEGKRLLAHELTHVVQAGGTVRRQPNAMISGGGGGGSGTRQTGVPADGTGSRDASGDQDAIEASEEDRFQFTFPDVDELSTAEKLQLLSQLQMAAGGGSPLVSTAVAGTLLSLYATSQILGYTAAAGVSGSIAGGVGGSVGGGIVFFPSGQIGVYGTGAAEIGYVLSAEANLEYTVMYGGRETFSGTAYGWSLDVDFGVSVGGTALTRTAEAAEVIGVSVEGGVGIGATVITAAGSYEETVVYTGTEREASGRTDRPSGSNRGQ